MPSSYSQEQELSTQEYWDNRYTDEHNPDAKSYDWLRTFDTIKPFLTRHLPPPDRNGRPEILHLGTGNSTLPMDLDTLGYKSQTAIDFSLPLITHMSALYPTIRFLQMDIRSLAFPSSSFDVCIDKATLDAMLYGSLWSPEPDVAKNVKMYVNEVARVLRRGGLWVYITWRQPHFIRPLIVREGVWSVEMEVVNKGEGGGVVEYFGWVCRKL